MFDYSVISQRLRIDKGSETGVMATIHSFLRKNHDDLEDATDSVFYGPSTSNKVCHCISILSTAESNK